MTIFPTAAGSLLCLSPQDLPAGQPLTDDEASLLKKWHSLSERNKGKIEYHIEELNDKNHHK